MLLERYRGTQGPGAPPPGYGPSAARASAGGSYFTRILRLSFLAPEIVKTILRDRHPLELTAKKLAGDTRLPIAWEEQRPRLGIA